MHFGCVSRSQIREKVCGWEENQTYRSDGVCYKEHCLVEFDLEQAEILSFVET